MSVVMRKVIFSTNHITQVSVGLVLCVDDGVYHINHFNGVRDTNTLESGIKDKEEAKTKFLEWVWELG